MQRDHTPPLRILLYALIALLVYVLESANGVPLRILGVRVDVLPAVAMAAALRDGPVDGIILGFITGALYDLSYTGAEGLLPIYFMVCGGVAGLLSRRYLRRILPSHMLLTACAMLLLGLLRYAYSWLVQTPMDTLRFFQLLCAETLVALFLSPILYAVARAVSRRFERGGAEPR